MLANGTANYIMQSNGTTVAPSWVAGSAIIHTTGTLSLGGNLAFTGANNVSFTTAGAYTYTLPSSTSTLAILGANTFTALQTFPASGAAILGSSTGKTTITSDNASATDYTAHLPAEDCTLGFRNIPQNSQSANYTTVLTDAGKEIYHPGADTTARTWTIDSNANVAYPIGTAITFINDTSAGVLTIAITTDTMILAGAGTTGSRTLAANGIATAVKMTSTRWIISGGGLT